MLIAWFLSRTIQRDSCCLIERKSVEPMAVHLAPGNVRLMHQSLHHIVADAAWSDDALLKQVRNQVLPWYDDAETCTGGLDCDRHGIPQERYSFGWSHPSVLRAVGQARQLPSGGEWVSLATEEASIPAAYRLYLPEVWANDKERRKEAGVPRK